LAVSCHYRKSAASFDHVVGAGSIGPGWDNGKATAVTFGREGAQLLCVDIDAAAAEETVGIIRGKGGEASAFRADVTRSANVVAIEGRMLEGVRPHRRARQQCRHRSGGRRRRGERGGMESAINLKSCFSP
jgi:hypothetical protein